MEQRNEEAISALERHFKCLSRAIKRRRDNVAFNSELCHLSFYQISEGPLHEKSDKKNFYARENFFFSLQKMGFSATKKKMFRERENFFFVAGDIFSV